MQTLIQQTVSGHEALLWNMWAPFRVRFQDQNLATKSVQPYRSEHPLCKHVEPSAHSVAWIHGNLVLMAGFMYLAGEMGNIGTLDLGKEGMRTIQTNITFSLSCKSTIGTSHLSLQRCTPQAQ